MKYFPLILLGVLLNAFAQILLKRGMSEIGQIGFAWKEIAPVIPRIATNLPVLIAISFYGISVLVWMAVLSKVEVSLAYPMLSIGYLVVLAYGFFWGQEQIGWERTVGILFIGMGVVFLFRSA